MELIIIKIWKGIVFLFMLSAITHLSTAKLVSAGGYEVKSKTLDFDAVPLPGLPPKLPPPITQLFETLGDFPPVKTLRGGFGKIKKFIEDYDIHLPSPLFDTVKVPLFDLEGPTDEIMKRHFERFLWISPVIIYATFLFGPAPFILLFYILRLLVGLGADLFVLWNHYGWKNNLRKFQKLTYLIDNNDFMGNLFFRKVPVNVRHEREQFLKSVTKRHYYLKHKCSLC